ncbi:hypothetical protein C8R46DRAFT_1068113 [Mycena filopes]|nr:hypothetical protein C8R46DRAFT_1068113 [Mycena filopes]
MTTSAVCLFALLALSTSATQAPLHSAIDSPTNFAGCNTTQRSHLERAFLDAIILASKGITVDINSMASMEFFGAPALVWGENHRLIQDNFARAAAYPQSSLRLTCADPADLCSRDSTTLAYNVDPEPTPHPVINFCPAFFAQRSLAEAYQYATEESTTKWYDLRYYDQNQGLVFLHQIMHISAVGQPPITDLNVTTPHDGERPARGPKPCKYLAFTNERRNVEKTIRNADTYAQYAMAMYVQERLGYPHEPVLWET